MSLEASQEASSWVLRLREQLLTAKQMCRIDKES